MVIVEARSILDDAIATHLEAFVNVAKALAEHPRDRQLSIAYARIVADLDRLLRLREALRPRAR